MCDLPKQCVDKVGANVAVRYVVVDGTNNDGSKGKDLRNASQQRVLREEGKTDHQGYKYPLYWILEKGPCMAREYYDSPDTSTKSKRR